MTIEKRFALCLTGLAAAAAGLWARDLQWMSNWDDAAPALAAIPLLWWLGRPWTMRSRARRFPAGAAAASGLLIALGIVTETLLLAAAGWTGLLACTLHTFIEADPRRAWTRLLPLALLGFPWLAFNSPWLGWWFRWSGAAAAELLLTALQFEVAREGTQMWTAGCCISVGEACSGLRGLQAMLIGGTVVAWQMLGGARGYWWHLPLLAAGAWAANTLRVVVTAIGVRWLPIDWMQGDAHLWQGWLLLSLMFLICLAGLRALRRGQLEAIE